MPINLLREIICLISILNTTFVLGAPIMLIAGLAVAYSLILYASSQQGQAGFSKTNNSSLSLRELNLMSSHVLPGLALRLVVHLVLP